MVIACIIVAIAIVSFIFIYYYTKDTAIVRIPKEQVMEFKTSIDLTGLPIVTFFQGKNKFNFLLDTGSNTSYVNSASSIEVVDTGKEDVFMGAEGADRACTIGTLKFYRGSKEYECRVNIANLEAAVNELKKCYGVTITGILGNDFFTKYKYCLDFKELVAYVRR